MSSLLVRHPEMTNCRPEGRQFRVSRLESLDSGARRIAPMPSLGAPYLRCATRRANVVDPLGGKEADWDMTKITKRTGIQIYRMKDTPELKGSDFVDDLEYANSELRDVFSLLSSASASLSRVLVRQTPDEGGFSVLYLFFKANYPLLRHRHGSDCLYVIVSGSAVMGRQTLNVGDSFSSLPTRRTHTRPARRASRSSRSATMWSRSLRAISATRRDDLSSCMKRCGRIQPHGTMSKPGPCCERTAPPRVDIPRHADRRRPPWLGCRLGLDLLLRPPVLMRSSHRYVR